VLVLLGFSRKNQQGKIAVSISIAKGVKFRATARFFCVTRIASGWCKVLKPIHGFNLTVIWGGLFHKLFNRLVENLMRDTVEKDKQRADQPFKGCRSAQSILSS
jgi:hypothetical protein